MKINNDIYRYASNGFDSEAVHSIRKQIRTLRSLISLAKPLINSIVYIELQKNLKDIANKFSYIRQLDVISGLWENFFNTKAFKMQSILESELMHKINNERKDSLSELLSFIISGDYNSLSGMLRDSLRDMELNFDSDSNFYDIFLNRLENWYANITLDLKNVDYTDIAQFHPLRVKIKKYRHGKSYISEHILINGIEAFDSKKALRLLGDLCDTYNNVKFLWDFAQETEIKQLCYECGLLVGQQIMSRERIVMQLKSL